MIGDPTSYHVTVLRREADAPEPAVVVRAEPLNDAPPIGPLDAANVLVLLAGPLRHPVLATLSRVSRSMLAAWLSADELDDPRVLLPNAELVVSAVRDDDVTPAEITLRATHPRWLEHLAPGDAWMFVPLPVPPHGPRSGPRSLSATPRLTLAIQMLELDRAGLRACIERERVGNPMIVAGGPWPPASADEAEVTVTRAPEGGWRACADVADLVPLRLGAPGLGGATDDQRMAVASQLADGRFFLRALWQRARVLERVAAAIAGPCEATVDRGEPLACLPSVHQVADAVSMHASTVQRVLRGKSLRGPAGVFPLESLAKFRPA
jgi:hypothetical protein